MMDLSKYNVLAVDDVPLNLLLIEKMLSRYEIRVRKATGGAEAMQEIASEKPDVLILDLMMPEVDGFEVLRRVRANPLTEDIRVIILSALNSNEDIIKGYELGANEFITKPILMEKLLNSVSTQLQVIEALRARG